MHNNYLVNVFVDGKCVDSYFAETLDGLMSTKAIYGKCELSIFDAVNYLRYTPEQVKAEVTHSYMRWKRSTEDKEKKTEDPKVERRKRHVNTWERKVICVETGEIFKSVRACSDETGIPYMTITNCVRRGNATRGLHFVHVKKELEEEIEQINNH